MFEILTCSGVNGNQYTHGVVFVFRNKSSSKRNGGSLSFFANLRPVNVNKSTLVYRKATLELCALTYLATRLSNADAVFRGHGLGHVPILVVATGCHVFYLVLCLCLSHFVALLPHHVLYRVPIDPIRVVCVSLSYLNPIHELAYQLTVPANTMNE